MMKQIICLMIFAMLLAGCSQKYTMATLNKLPKGRGAYTGSVRIIPWRYRGSTEKYHYFTYTFHRGGVRRFEGVQIPYDELELNFEMKRTNKKDKWITVTPIYDGDRIVDFGLIFFED